MLSVFLSYRGRSRWSEGGGPGGGGGEEECRHRRGRQEHQHGAQRARHDQQARSLHISPSHLVYLSAVFRIRIHWFQIRINDFRLNTSTVPDQYPGFSWPKLKKIYCWEKITFWSKIAIYLYLGLHKGRPSYRRSLQPSKENIQDKISKYEIS